MQTDTQIWPIMAKLLECVVAEITARELPIPDVQQVAPGDVAVLELYEGCEGTAWVRLVSAFPSTDFPIQDAEPSKFWNGEMAYNVEIGVSRDIQLDEQGGPTDVAVMIEASELQLAYMTAMRVAICKCLGFEKRRFLLQDYSPAIGGGSVDGQWTVFISGS